MSEAKRLREIISKVATNIGNGAFCSPSCSLEFMESVAEEVRLEIADLRTKLAAETKRADDAEAQRDKLAELLREHAPTLRQCAMRISGRIREQGAVLHGLDHLVPKNVTQEDLDTFQELVCKANKAASDIDAALAEMEGNK